MSGSPLGDERNLHGQKPGDVVQGGTFAPSLGGRNYDVSPDGRRFLMLKMGAAGASAQDPPARITVVENWFEELKRLAPGK